MEPTDNWTKVRTSDGDVLLLATSDLLVPSIEASAASLALITAAWTSWVPALNQGGAVTSSFTYAKYIDIGKTRIAAADGTATATGTGTNTITVTLPAGQTAVNAAGAALGTGQVNLAATGKYGVLVQQAATGASPSVAFLRQDTNAPTASLGVDPITAIDSGKVVRFVVAYELA